MMEHETIFEVIDSLTNDVVADTESRYDAEEWYAKGYIIVEHRIVTIPVSSTRRIVLADSETWSE